MYVEDEERKRYWNGLDRDLDRVGNECRLYVIGDLNGWVEDMGGRI